MAEQNLGKAPTLAACFKFCNRFLSCLATRFFFSSCLLAKGSSPGSEGKCSIKVFSRQDKLVWYDKNFQFQKQKAFKFQLQHYLGTFTSYLNCNMDRLTTYHQSSWPRWWVHLYHHQHDHNQSDVSKYQFAHPKQPCLSYASWYLQNISKPFHQWLTPVKTIKLSNINKDKSRSSKILKLIRLIIQGPILILLNLLCHNQNIQEKRPWMLKMITYNWPFFLANNSHFVGGLGFGSWKRNNKKFYTLNIRKQKTSSQKFCITKL